MDKSLSARTLAIGVLAGIAAGVAVGYVTAPRSGKETRGLIRDKTLQVGTRARGMFCRSRGSSAAVQSE